MRFFIFILGWCLLASGVAFSAPVAEPIGEAPTRAEIFAKGTRLTGLAAGISLGTREYGGRVTHDMAVVNAHYGVVVTDVLFEDALMRGRVALGGEFLFAQQYQPKAGFLAGATPLVRYLFETEGRWKPFVNAGIGFAFTDIGGPSLGGEFQFSPQVGAGVYFLMTPSVALGLQHRFIHYSNGNMRSPNTGINQHVFLLGVTRLH